MASLKEIAAEVGVSYTLVSKVLRGKLGTAGASKATKEAIFKKAKELNYVPNRMAVALKGGRNGAVGIFLHRLGSDGSHLTERMLLGLADGLRESGGRLWLRFFNSEAEFVEACDLRLRSEVDGLIVAGVNHPELAGRLSDLEEAGVPVVTIFSDSMARKESTVVNAGVDFELQGFIPTKHLIDIGAGPLGCLAFTENRTRGFHRAHQEAGLSVSRKVVISSPGFTMEDGVAGISALLKSTPKLGGVVCQSDAQAVGVINELMRRGIRVPDDIRVTGVDNSPLAKHCAVPITSVTSEMQSAGRTAVEMLLRKLDGKPAVSVKLTPEIVIRNSTIG